MNRWQDKTDMRKREDRIALLYAEVEKKYQHGIQGRS